MQQAGTSPHSRWRPPVAASPPRGGIASVWGSAGPDRGFHLRGRWGPLPASL